MRRNSNGNLCDRNGMALCHRAVVDKLRGELGLESPLVAEQQTQPTGHWSLCFEQAARLLVFSDASYREIEFMTGITVDSVRTYASWLRRAGVPFGKRYAWTGYRTANPTRFRP